MLESGGHALLLLLLGAARSLELVGYFLFPLQKHRSCSLSLFPGLELLLSSDAKAWHWEVLFPSRPTSLEEEGDARMHSSRFFPTDWPMEGSAASLQLL